MPFCAHTQIRAQLIIATWQFNLLHMIFHWPNFLNFKNLCKCTSQRCQQWPHKQFSQPRKPTRPMDHFWTCRKMIWRCSWIKTSRVVVWISRILDSWAEARQFRAWGVLGGYSGTVGEEPNKTFAAYPGVPKCYTRRNMGIVNEGALKFLRA